MLKYIWRDNKTSAKLALVQYVTFIDLHNLHILVMFFYIDINHEKTLHFDAIIFEIDCVLTKILTIMYT